jgi:hypothetical protein
VSEIVELYAPAANETDLEFLTRTKGEIRELRRTAVSAIVAIGDRLVAVQSRVGRGRYNAFVREQLGWSKSSAHRFVQVAAVLKGPNLGPLEHWQIDVSSLYLLARSTTPDRARRQVFEKAASSGGVRHSEVKRIIKGLSVRPEQQVPLAASVAFAELPMPPGDPPTVSRASAREAQRDFASYLDRFENVYRTNKTLAAVIEIFREARAMLAELAVRETKIDRNP